MSDPIHDYLSEIGRKGGAAGRGSAKARTSDQARAAVQARWARTKRKKKRKAKRPNPSVLGRESPSVHSNAMNVRTLTGQTSHEINRLKRRILRRDARTALHPSRSKIAGI